MINSSAVDPRHQERLQLAIAIAEEAGAFTLRYFQSDNLVVERKGDDSPVTVADRGAEELLRARIIEAFPDDAILGEELPEREGTSGFRWILDPIDGTKSFIHGVPLYATLIGIEDEDETVVGVLRIPALAECVFAARGAGAWRLEGAAGEPRPARVSECSSLKEALFLTSEVRTFNECGRRDAFDELQDACRLTRTWGDAYGYFLVATGRADVMVDAELSAWDAAPMLTILEEAGGLFTDWQGRATIHSGDAIGVAPGVFDEVLAITKKYPKKA